MTPEERAVINAAINWRRAIPGRDRDVKLTIELERVIWDLITSCQQCNHETHTCGGCGAEVGHGEYTCSDCDAPQHDPLSGDLIPAGQDADLERMGREMAQHPSDPSTCVNALGERSGPQDCVILQADIDQELADYRSDVCPKCGGPCEDVCMFAGGSDEEEEERATGEDDLIWHPRTMRDARKGDQIRPAGSDMPNGTAVTDRLLSPQPPSSGGGLPSDRGTWHVVPGASGKHWDDHVVQPGEVWLCLDGGAPQSLNPDFPIEILLTRAEIAAIDALGWGSRMDAK